MSTTAPRHTDETGDNAYGISIFAGVLLAMLGGFHILQGLSAVLKDDIFVKGADYTYKIDLTTWGWIMMIWGVVLLLAGFGLLSGATWARWFAIVVASLNVIAQLGFVGSAQYPLWALTVLTLTIVVLYALIVHWDDGTQPA